MESTVRACTQFSLLLGRGSLGGRPRFFTWVLRMGAGVPRSTGLGSFSSTVLSQ